MLVEDAVVVGENTYIAHRRDAGQLARAIQGTQQVMVPVTFGALTTVATLTLLLFAAGKPGKYSLSFPPPSSAALRFP